MLKEPEPRSKSTKAGKGKAPKTKTKSKPKSSFFLFKEKLLNYSRKQNEELKITPVTQGKIWKKIGQKQRDKYKEEFLKSKKSNCEDAEEKNSVKNSKNVAVNLSKKHSKKCCSCGNCQKCLCLNKKDDKKNN